MSKIFILGLNDFALCIIPAYHVCSVNIYSFLLNRFFTVIYMYSSDDPF